MIRCPPCSSRIPAESRFCSTCGEEFAAASQAATATAETPRSKSRLQLGDRGLDVTFTR